MRGRFDEAIPFEVVGLPPRKWRLDAPLRFRSPYLHAWVQVPNGFVTDGASVPWWAAWAMPREGRGFRAAIVHDWLYHAGGIVDKYGPETLTKHEADEVYLEALEACGVNWLQRHLAFAAVVIAGGAAWDKHRQAEEERA